MRSHALLRRRNFGGKWRRRDGRARPSQARGSANRASPLFFLVIHDTVHARTGTYPDDKYSNFSLDTSALSSKGRGESHGSIGCVASNLRPLNYLQSAPPAIPIPLFSWLTRCAFYFGAGGRRRLYSGRPVVIEEEASGSHDRSLSHTRTSRFVKVKGTF
jgi:hypothetical protein